MFYRLWIFHILKHLVNVPSAHVSPPLNVDLSSSIFWVSFHLWCVRPFCPDLVHGTGNLIKPVGCSMRNSQYQTQRMLLCWGFSIFSSFNGVTPNTGCINVVVYLGRDRGGVIEGRCSCSGTRLFLFCFFVALLILFLPGSIIVLSLL